MRIVQPSAMERWAKGYSKSQLDSAQERYGLTFPPDLLELLLDRQPAAAYDWSIEDPRIREMLGWPYEALMFDIENGFWWPAWQERPSKSEERAEVLRNAIAKAPKLIPLYSHRFLPETPCDAGNPVFSMHGFDTIYYGSNLQDYFSREFGSGERNAVSDARHIEFWSDIVERFGDAYEYYSASEDARDNVESVRARLEQGQL